MYSGQQLKACPINKASGDKMRKLIIIKIFNQPTVQFMLDSEFSLANALSFPLNIATSIYKSCHVYFNFKNYIFINFTYYMYCFFNLLILVKNYSFEVTYTQRKLPVAVTRYQSSILSRDLLFIFVCLKFIHIFL